jgi:N-acetylglucosaminyldiphosphoundecaprenol N-acetyl-beta-D-mannosaminyltransferase
VEARRNEAGRRALESANVLIPDGVGVVLGSRLLGVAVSERVSGPDIFLGLMRSLDEAGGKSVYFLGSTEENLGRIRERVAREFPRIRWAGSYAPPFKAEFTEEEDAAMVEAVNESGADVLWVGMTAPKQEIWIHRNLPRLKVQLAGAIGAAFDFYSGKVKRSHWVWRRLGLEWLPRLLKEPRRLWRRMFISAPVFMWAVVREKWLRGS